MNNLIRKVQAFRRRILAKYMRSSVVTAFIPCAISFCLTIFVIRWAFGDITFLREQTRQEYYSELKVVESQINSTIRSEFDSIAIVAGNTSIQLANGSNRAMKGPQPPISSNVQIWRPNAIGTALIADNQEPLNLLNSHAANPAIDPAFQEFMATYWQRLSKRSNLKADPHSILEQANLSLDGGGSTLAFVVPIIGSDGRAKGLVCSKHAATKLQNFLPEYTYLLDPHTSTVLSKTNPDWNVVGNETSRTSPDVHGDLSSAAARIQISPNAPSWRLRAEHSTSELWSRPEVRRILDFHAALILIIWGVAYLWIQSTSRARNRQRMLIGSLVQKIIWITDEVGTIDCVLGMISTHLGWKELDYLDVNIELFVHPEDREKLTLAIESAKDSESKNSLHEIRFENKDREFRWYEVRVANMIHVPEINGLVVTAHDIEQRMHATAHILASKRAAEKANEAKSEFLSRMSHELRTPLNAILGFGQLLEMEAITDRQAENVDQILIAGRHLLDLVNDILDIARIETRKVNLSVERVNIRDVIDESFALLGPLSTKSQVKLECEAFESSDIWSDRQRLKQIFLNLLSNGIKYNHAGGHVRVSVVETKEFLKVHFSDGGIGIESHYLDRVFTPFDRLGSETSDVEGSGLGLALSKTLVEAMGASVEVNSEFGKGSVFTVTFSASAIAKSVEGLQAEEGGLIDSSKFEDPSKLRVLLIEDNIVNLRYISKVIEKMDHVALMSAKEGGIGIELARSFDPDLILLDLDLPDISGKEVLTALQSDPLTQDISVVVMSAETNPHVVEEILALGAREFVTKPVDVNSLFVLFDEERKAA